MADALSFMVGNYRKIVFWEVVILQAKIGYEDSDRQRFDIG